MKIRQYIRFVFLITSIGWMSLSFGNTSKYHVLLPGETLYRVSKYYSVPVDSLLKWNNITSLNELTIGKKIYVEPTGNIITDTSKRKIKSNRNHSAETNSIELKDPKVYNSRKLKTDKVELIGFPQFIEDQRFEGDNPFYFEAKEVYGLLAEDANFYLVLFYFTSCFVLSSIIFFINLFFIRSKRYVTLRKENKLKKEINDHLSQLFFEVPYLEPEELKLRKRELILENIQLKFNKNYFTTKCLVDALIQLRVNFSGQTSDQVRNVYFELGLHNFAIKRFNNKDTWEKIDAIKEMAMMGVDEIRFEVEKLINSKSKTLRIEAQQFLVFFKEYCDLRFLVDAHYLMSYWDYMRLYTTLKNNLSVEVPQYDHLLYSKNPSVVLVGVLLIRNFKQQNCAKSLLTVMSEHRKNPKIQVEIVETLIKLEYLEAKEPMLAIYEQCQDVVKGKILELIGMTGDDDNIKFLQKELSKEKNSSTLKLSAGLALKQVSRSGEFILSQMLSSVKGDDKFIVQHALDRRI